LSSGALVVDQRLVESCAESAGARVNILYRDLVPGLWIAWLLYWRISATAVKPAQRRETPASRAAHIVPMLIAAILLWVQPIPGGGVLFERFLPASHGRYWAGTLLLALGLAFSVWARVYIGRNWSATVTVKEGHELIRHGPYALVRHPIYTGLLLGFIGTAIVRGEWRAVLAVLIVVAALWRKLRLEECWMSETFGDEYRRYREHTAALIPFLL
jgi:protein-S-isoprenylcysteine O-methyltransferase Ste14